MAILSKPAVHCSLQPRCHFVVILLFLCHILQKQWNTLRSFLVICIQHAHYASMQSPRADCMSEFRSLSIHLTTQTEFKKLEDERKKHWRTAIRGIIIVRSYTQFGLVWSDATKLQTSPFPALSSIPFSHHHIHTRAYTHEREGEVDASLPPPFRTVFSRKET